MKVLAVNGSHRPGHNTAAMLNMVLDEVKAEGFEAELIELYKHKIRLCKSCNKCLMKPECAIKDDDMAMIIEKLLAADAIILGSPVYFGNVSGIMKIFIDRSRSMHMCKNALDGKIGAALTHAGLRNGGQEMTQMILERFLQCHGLHVVEARDPETGIFNGGPLGTMFDSMVGENIKWKKDVSEDTLTVKTCSSLGKNIVRLLKQK
jgi:multimeric flavodoxin WrbA